METKAKKCWKIIGLSALVLVLIFITIVLGYVAYMSANYYRIEDELSLVVENNKEENITLETDYTISTYNIGFGAYNQDFDFFMDTGTMLDGTVVTGTRAKAESKEVVVEDTEGAIETIKGLDTDFAFFQEVDTKSTRSYFVNQYEMIKNAFQEFSSSFASNFHTSYLIYPFNDHIGSIQSGIVTLSKYNISSSTRRSFPIDESFVNKFFDLDRCFVVNRLNIEGTDKQLVLINLHMSAYDEGGVIRAKQLEMLTNLISFEYEKGNYVIAGGDWNHDIAGSINTFESQQKTPDWVKEITDDDIPEGFSFAQTTLTTPTCRSAEMAYKKGVNYTVVIDGFLVSDNIKITNTENIDTDFMFSDHNPVKMTFSLIKENEQDNPETGEETGETPSDESGDEINSAENCCLDFKKRYSVEIF